MERSHIIRQSLVALGIGAWAFLMLSLASSFAVHVDKRLCRKKPFHQLRPANPERIFKRLIRPGRIAIQRNTNTLNYDFRHTFTLNVLAPNLTVVAQI